MASQIPITVRAPPAAASPAAPRGKKRPASPAAGSAQPVPGSSKKKKGQLTATPAATQTQVQCYRLHITAAESVAEVKAVGTVEIAPNVLSESTAKPPPFKDPAFVANYTDPQTKLRFTSSEEFSYIRLLPTDVVTGYLALRKATCIVP
ncbi:hypothetical protein F7725_018516 [Dissostichus mawsoni]|uniref:Vps72/YL1 C-terminal domain-containing protein n=1 Tax=Dissostichus mawsoni TaxID=36200 RepID=A0A7J5XTB3_DISMA|nr:hypothetical protein F7725_018516 [Dissostichus mawsoni]